MRSKRDLVKAAVDQWDQEMRLRCNASRRRAVGQYALFGSIILLCLAALRIQSPFGKEEASFMILPGPVMPVADDEGIQNVRKIAIAESRVMGVMRGRRLKSREGVQRVFMGVSHLSRHFDRKRIGP